MDYKVGDRVRLIEIPDLWPGAHIPEETGEILSIDEMPWGLSVVVLVDEEHRDPDGDDGLRELTADQIKEKL